jgi:hypothetical protein
MTNRVMLLVVHLLLLVLASTSFTVVTGLGDGHYQWEYFRHSWQRGWGASYPFPYSLGVVLVYLAAYAVGVAAYCMAWRSGSPVIGIVGVVLCGFGLASFAFELTHWFAPHYASWIASAPVALLVLAPMAVIQQYRLQTPWPNNSDELKSRILDSRRL